MPRLDSLMACLANSQSMSSTEALHRVLSEAGRKGGKRGSRAAKSRAGKLGIVAMRKSLLEKATNGNQPTTATTDTKNRGANK